MADEMLCIGHNNEIPFSGSGIDDDFDKCRCCTENDHKSFCRECKEVVVVYMIVPLLIERSECRGPAMRTFLYHLKDK